MVRRSLVGIVSLLGASALLVGQADAFPLGRWAHPQYRGGIYRSTAPWAKRIGRLHWYTEDGFLEVYRVSSNVRIGRDRHQWVQVQSPRRPRALRGWVRRAALGPIYTSPYQLRLSRFAHQARLYKKKRGRWYRVWQARIAVGKPSTPTPGGIFWVRERIRNLGSSGLYGPWAFGTSAYSVLSDWPGGGIVGLHGTNQPWLLGSSVSHGCIRMGNSSIRSLARRLGVGTPVIIR